MNKRIGKIIVSGVMACTMTASIMVTAAACGGRTKADFVMPEGGFDTSKNVEITFSHTMGSNLRDVLDEYIAEFNKIYPNITVTHEQVGGYDDVRDTILDQMVAGNQPNLAYCYPDHVALYNRANAVQTLDDFLPGGAYADYKVTLQDGTEVNLGLTQDEVDSFIPGYFNEGYEFGDGTKMYTLPFSKSTEVLYYNEKYFTDNNLTVPKTWTEMKTLCAKIVELSDADVAAQKAKGVKDDDLLITMPFGYDSEANWFITMCEQYESPYTSATGDKYLFDNEQNRKFVKEFKEWYDAGYFTTQALYGSYTSGLFTNLDKGLRSVMCIGSSAGASHQAPATVNGSYPFTVGIAPIPQVETTKPKAISQGPSVCIFKQDDPQEVLASWLFLKFLTTNVDFQAAFSEASGYIPVLNSETMEKSDAYKAYLADANGGDGLMARAVKVAMEQENAYYTSPAFVGSSKARDEVGNLLQAVFSTKVNSAEELTKLIDDSFKAAVKECEYFAK